MNEPHAGKLARVVLTGEGGPTLSSNNHHTGRRRRTHNVC